MPSLVPLLAALVLGLVVVAAAVYGCFERLVAPRTVSEGRCTGCGYDLGGLPEWGLCPECGGGFDKTDVREFVTWKFRTGRARKIVGVLILTGLVFAVKPVYELDWFLSHGYGWRSPWLAFVWAQREEEYTLEWVVAACYFLWGILLVGHLRYPLAVALYVGGPIVGAAVAAFLNRASPQLAQFALCATAVAFVALAIQMGPKKPWQQPPRARL